MITMSPSTLTEIDRVRHGFDSFYFSNEALFFLVHSILLSQICVMSRIVLHGKDTAKIKIQGKTLLRKCVYDHRVVG